MRENKRIKRYILVVLVVIAIMTLSILRLDEDIINNSQIISTESDDKIVNNDEYHSDINNFDDESVINIAEIELPNEYKPMTVKNYAIDNDIPALDFSITEGQGIPSIILKNPSEYSNKNPWFQNEDVKVLPVFINKGYNPKYHEGPLEYLTEEESVEVSLLVGEKLGINTNKYESISYGNSYYMYFPNREECVVRVEPSVKDIRIFIEGTNKKEVIAELPNIQEENEHTLQEKYLVYFYNVYEKILKMEQPIFEITFDRYFNGDRNYNYRVFNQEETVEDTIINYNLNSTDFWINTNYLDGAENGLRFVDVSYKQLLESANSNEFDGSIIEKLANKNKLELLGNYPLISKEEAVDKVLRKEYLSVIDYDRDIDKSDIMSIELVYYAGPTNKIILPIYKVYLNLKDTVHDYSSEDNGLEHYGLFYVPAIKGQYLNITYNESNGKVGSDFEGTVDSEVANEYYFEPNVSIIEGTLITRLHYGPPGYGEDPDNDEKRYPFILQLDDPIKVIAEDTDVFNSSIFDVTEIQLVLKGAPYVDMAKQYKNKHIKVQGTLFSAFTGYHHTEVLIVVDKILD